MSTAKFDTLQNRAGTKSVPVDTVVDGSAKAWVNFNGTGTVAIRASFNVTSITDNGTGDYTVNFTSAMPDTNYTVQVAAAANLGNQFVAYENMSRTKAVGQAHVTTYASGVADFSIVYASFFR